MANKTGLGFSPLSGRIYWGLQNDKGLWVGNKKKDITSDFLQVMEHKFPVGFSQNITVNGEHASTIANICASKSVYAIEIDICHDVDKLCKLIAEFDIKDDDKKSIHFAKFLCRDVK